MLFSYSKHHNSVMYPFLFPHLGLTSQYTYSFCARGGSRRTVGFRGRRGTPGHTDSRACWTGLCHHICFPKRKTRTNTKIKTASINLMCLVQTTNTFLVPLLKKRVHRCSDGVLCKESVSARLLLRLVLSVSVSLYCASMEGLRDRQR